MKKISFITIMLLLIITTQNFAQVKFGVKAGLNLANMSVNGLPSGYEQKMRMSFHIGGMLEYSIAESFAVEASILLSGKGVNNEYNETKNGNTFTAKSITSPLYIEVPINIVYKADLNGTKLLFFAGPYFGLGIAGKISNEYSVTGGLPAGVTLHSLGYDDKTVDIEYGSDNTSNMKALDFGLNLGAGIEITNFQISLQYGLGLANLIPVTTTVTHLKNNVISVSFGYLFGK